MKRCREPGGDSTLSGGIFDLPGLQHQISEIETQQAEPSFWDDPDAAQKQMKRLARLREKANPFLALDRRLADIEEFREMLSLEPDEALEAESDANALAFLADLERYEIQTLLSGEYDDRSAIVEINAGAGGSEACDWASILFRLYSRWIQEKGFKMEVLSETPGDVTGYRNIQFRVDGLNAYGYLKAENGVHRLVRISPFDAAARRHTSFCKLEVMPEIEESEVDIDPEDLKVETLRAGGAGGQHVNKTESAVRITHIPSGIVVACQNERSQHQNRAMAMMILAARLQERMRLEQEGRLSAIKGDTGPAEWGRQIRSYVMQPYTMVKDHRTGHETGNIMGVLDGDIDGFIEAWLKRPKDAGDDFIE